jgi:hypothetical protein
MSSIFSLVSITLSYLNPYNYWQSEPPIEANNITDNINNNTDNKADTMAVEWSLVEINGKKAIVDFALSYQDGVIKHNRVFSNKEMEDMANEIVKKDGYIIMDKFHFEELLGLAIQRKIELEEKKYEEEIRLKKLKELQDAELQRLEAEKIHLKKKKWFNL